MVEVKKTPHPYRITMTSNTAPALYTLTASSELASQPAWKAFANSWWYATSSVPQWINMDFGLLREIGYIRFTNSGNATSIPTSYTLSSSKDGITFTELVTEKYTWDSVNREHKVDFPQDFYKAIKLTINSVSGTGGAIVGEILFGYYTYSSYMAIKNDSSYYSLSDNTLTHLPDNSPKNMILHGIEQGKEIQLDVPFDKHRYFNDTPANSASGKVFTHDINKINTLSIKEVIDSKSYKPVYTWHETNMTSNTTPSPRVVTASSYYSNSAYELPPYKAFDGNNTSDSDSSSASTWATANNSHINSWIKIDFGEIKKVNAVQLTPRYESWVAQTPKEFIIESSLDDSSWKEIGKFNISNWSSLQRKNLDLLYSEARYFRITHLSTNGAIYASWCEIKYGYKREVN